MEGGTLGAVGCKEGHWKMFCRGRHTGRCWVEGGTLRGVGGGRHTGRCWWREAHWEVLVEGGTLRGVGGERHTGRCWWREAH